MPTFDEILQQRLRDQNAQGVPAALDPNVPGQTTNINDLLKAQLPQDPTASPMPSQPMPASTSAQDIPDSLLPNDAYQEKHKEDLINKIMSGVGNTPAAETTTDVAKTPPTDTEPAPPTEESAPEEIKEEPSKPEEKEEIPEGPSIHLEAGSNEGIEPEAAEKIAAVEQGRPATYLQKHDTYGIDELQQRMQDARRSASQLMGLAATQQAVGNATGRPAEISALTHAANNELGKAQDYQQLLNEQRSEMKDDISSDANTLNHQKAMLEFNNEKARNDANSDVSKMYRTMAEQVNTQLNLSTPINPNMTADQVSKSMPWVQNAAKTKNAMDMKQLQIESNERLRQQMLQMQMDKYKEGQEKFLDTQGNKFEKEVNANLASSRSQLGQHIRAINMADRIQDQFGNVDPNKLNKQQIATLTTDYVSMMTGGIPTQAAIQKMFPETGAGTVKDIVQYITNDPTGRNQGKFVKQMLNGTQTLKNLSTNKIKGSIDLSTSGFSRFSQERPDQAEEIRNRALQNLVHTTDTTPSGTVKMQDPTGKIRLIPATQVNDAIAAGGKVVQ
jgi:hypothetical protein